jgi:hypothetical protein
MEVGVKFEGGSMEVETVNEDLEERRGVRFSYINMIAETKIDYKMEYSVLF